MLHSLFRLASPETGRTGDIFREPSIFIGGGALTFRLLSVPFERTSDVGFTNFLILSPTFLIKLILSLVAVSQLTPFPLFINFLCLLRLTECSVPSSLEYSGCCPVINSLDFEVLRGILLGATLALPVDRPLHATSTGFLCFPCKLLVAV